MQNNNNKKYTVVDLFSGVGGLSYGFYHHPDFEIIFANEIDAETAKSYEQNHPDVKVYACDIRDLADNIDPTLKRPVDVVVGGPPCQSYSTLGKRQNDDRANLFYEYCKQLEILKPKIFVFENVVGMLSMNNGKLMSTVLKEFDNLGYDVKYHVLNAADYGVPQIRNRLIIVGSKHQNSFEFPKATHTPIVDGELKEKHLLPYVTLAEAIGDFPIQGSGDSISEYLCEPQNDFQKLMRGDCKKIIDNDIPNNSPHLVELMKALPDGGNRRDLPAHLRPKSGYANTYAKFWWNRPAYTLTRNFGCVSSSRCIHPRDSRALSTREGARLQSFPDNFIFVGTRSKKNLQIGNAVPPILSKKIAEQIKLNLDSLGDEVSEIHEVEYQFPLK